MPLDPRFMIAPSIQEYFVDKDTGLPLSHGLVYYFSDVNRNVLKPIYTLEGAPPYSPSSYIALPNPNVLSGVGTTQDANGNDVIPYYFPYDANGNIELYYIVVTDQFGVAQFTREAYPNFIGPTPPSPGLIFPENFIPNGQFLIHNASFPNTPTSTFNYGIYSTKVQNVAPSGWTFEAISTSTAVDEVTFFRQNQLSFLESASPRYFISLNRTTSSTDTVVDLRIKWNDVNKFSSETNQTYTLLFNYINNGPSINVQIFQIFYYGTSAVGGTAPSATQEVVFGTAQSLISTSSGQLAFTDVFAQFPINVVGDNDDDFIQLAIRFPTLGGAIFNVELTDFMLIKGSIPVDTPFPTTTNGQFVLEALSNLAPVTTGTDETYYSQDGSNLYLPIVMTQQGFTYDYGQLGIIEACGTEKGFFYNSILNSVSNLSNLIRCDGSSYISKNYSILGIPYKRIQKVLFDTSINLPIYGTGLNFVTAGIYEYNTAVLRLTRNEAGIETNTLDGTSPTGFSFTNRHPGNALTYGFAAYETATNFPPAVLSPVLFVQGLVTGAAFIQASDGVVPTGWYVSQEQDLNRTQQFWLVAIGGVGVPPAGSYIQSSNTVVGVFFWFTVNGVGAVPPGAGVAVKVDLLSTYTNTDVANVLSAAINAEKISDVTITGVPPAGSFFTFFSRTLQYNVWYSVNGVGLEPVVPSGANIKVSILNTDSTSQIAVKTQLAINNYQFAVPRLQGSFLRGLEDNLGNFWDKQSADRFSLTNESYYKGKKVGTYQLDSILQHIHPPGAPGSQFTLSAGATINLAPAAISGQFANFTGPSIGSQDLVHEVSGGFESRPYNMYVIFAIRY